MHAEKPIFLSASIRSSAFIGGIKKAAPPAGRGFGLLQKAGAPHREGPRNILSPADAPHGLDTGHQHQMFMEANTLFILAPFFSV
jgi:hypothetical protein